MQKLILLVLISLFFFSSCAEKPEQKENVATYYLIRHAEKDRIDKTNKNPNLNNIGLERAKNWRNHFKDVKFDAIYSTDYNRTKQTALPTAQANNIDIQLYSPSDIKFEAFLSRCYVSYAS